MSLNLGQTIICGIKGTVLSAKEKKFLTKNKIGGIVLFKYNYQDIKQLKELITSLKKIDPKIFIAVDHEGGTVQRFREGFTLLPDAAVLGKKAPIHTYLLNKKAAQELKEVGININFTPCADIYRKGKLLKLRSFGKNYLKIGEYVSMVIKAYQEENIFSCAKHFPGHGITDLDTHDALPKTNSSLKTLNHDLHPFLMAIRNNVEMVMLSHIKTIDSDNYPVSFSKTYIDFLRNQWNYNGLLITDDLKMDAIQISDEEIPSVFLNAGGDILLTRSLEQAEAFIEGMNHSKIKTMATQRIIKFKKKLCF